MTENISIFKSYFVTSNVKLVFKCVLIILTVLDVFPCRYNITWLLKK